MVYRGMRHTYQVLSSCKYTSLIKWTQLAMFVVTKLRRGHDFTRDKGGELLNHEPMGKNPCVTFPSLTQLPPLKTIAVSWGSYGWEWSVAGLSVLTHTHTPPMGWPHIGKEKQPPPSLQQTPHSHYHTILSTVCSSSRRDGSLFILMHRHLFCLISCSEEGSYFSVLIHVLP